MYVCKLNNPEVFVGGEGVVAVFILFGNKLIFVCYLFKRRSLLDVCVGGDKVSCSNKCRDNCDYKEKDSYNLEGGFAFAFFLCFFGFLACFRCVKCQTFTPIFPFFTPIFP